MTQLEEGEETMLNFRKIIPEIRPLTDSVLPSRKYPSLESDFLVDASQNPYLGGYGLVSLQWINSS